MAAKSVKAIFLLSIAGVLFAGYLTISKMIGKVCPFNESCPYLLGYPVCIYGLVMYSALLVLSGLMLFRGAKLLKALAGVSAAGMLFSGYYSVQEIFYTTCPEGCNYALLLPTCVYGLVMYLVIFIISWVALRKR